MSIGGKVSTGFESLDKIIDSLRIGDNVVWQVDNIEDYRFYVDRFVKNSVRENKQIIYLRFANHEPLVEEGKNISVYTLDPATGFDTFSAEIYNLIKEKGDGVFYVFDSLSDLLLSWATDLMIGNFFLIVCPFLYQLNTVAYFALFRNRHSFKTVARIRETTQVLIDVHNIDNSLYIHPLKVKERHSPTMFLPHHKREEEFIPLTSSLGTTELLSHISRIESDSPKRNLDYWDRLFLRVEEVLKDKEQTDEKQKLKEQICRIVIGRDERFLELSMKNFSLEDLLNIKTRLIGTGYIGGKAAGMLLARKILLNDNSYDWHNHLEPHDSYFIGTDVFYTYIVENGWWKMIIEQKTKEGYFRAAKELEHEMLSGTFPDEIKEQFWHIIEYFGQSPFIVRSSSLMEDAFGNAFAGKYESIFCVNQGTPEQRFSKLTDSVRRVYASAMDEDALSYRIQRGLDQQDEQMALLVQRVSGSYRSRFFFPDMAGVGFSYNPYLWNEHMDPKAGMLRLVVGLGTRAVNRVENDYPRIIALDDPLSLPGSSINDIRRYSQHYVDVLNFETNELETESFAELIRLDTHIDKTLLCEKDLEASELLTSHGGQQEGVFIVTFENFLKTGSFVSVMQKMLKKLESMYDYPVDVEFTVNIEDSGSARINLVQCRPLQVKGERKKVDIPQDSSIEKTVFRTSGTFMGGSAVIVMDRIIYVDPESYSHLSESDKYAVARFIGRVNKTTNREKYSATLLIGPGRWGTTTPSLGIPVRFSEINNMAAIIEIGYLRKDFMPDISYGTHFFQDLVETDISYFSIFPEKQDSYLNEHFIKKTPVENIGMHSEEKALEGVVRVLDVRELKPVLMADIISRQAVCFIR